MVGQLQDSGLDRHRGEERSQVLLRLLAALLGELLHLVLPVLEHLGQVELQLEVGEHLAGGAPQAAVDLVGREVAQLLLVRHVVGRLAGGERLAAVQRDPVDDLDRLQVQRAID